MKKFTSLIFVVLMVKSLNAQMLTPTVISSGGAFYSNASAMLSTTIGELTMIETFSSSANFLTQGFQQPEILTVGLEESPASNNAVLIFPNPATDVFTLSANFKEGGTIEIIVYNALGQETLRSPSIISTGGVINIPVDSKKLAAGIYLVKTVFVSSAHQKFTHTLKLTINK